MKKKTLITLLLVLPVTALLFWHFSRNTDEQDKVAVKNIVELVELCRSLEMNGTEIKSDCFVYGHNFTNKYVIPNDVDEYNRSVCRIKELLNYRFERLEGVIRYFIKESKNELALYCCEMIKLDYNLSWKEAIKDDDLERLDNFLNHKMIADRDNNQIYFSLSLKLNDAYAQEDWSIELHWYDRPLLYCKNAIIDIYKTLDLKIN